MSSKSANYCFANQKNNQGLLLLSEVSFSASVYFQHISKHQKIFIAHMSVRLNSTQVALGDSNELLDANYNADQLLSGKHSTKGLGQTAPNPNNHVTLWVWIYISLITESSSVLKNCEHSCPFLFLSYRDGATVPMGPSGMTGVGQKGGYSLMYNEYIVYNPAQTRMKYLLRVQFNFSSLWWCWRRCFTLSETDYNVYIYICN